MRRALIAALAVLLSACGSPPATQSWVRDGQGSSYPANVRVMCSWPSGTTAPIMSHDCAAGGGTIGPVATDGEAARGTVQQEPSNEEKALAACRADPDCQRWDTSTSSPVVVTVPVYVPNTTTITRYVTVPRYVPRTVYVPTPVYTPRPVYVPPVRPIYIPPPVYVPRPIYTPTYVYRKR
jgi:hypothetical protein